jgi:hypothetical protein
LCRSKQDEGRVRIFSCRIGGDGVRINETIYVGGRRCCSSIVTVSIKENKFVLITNWLLRFSSPIFSIRTSLDETRWIGRRGGGGGGGGGGEKQYEL